MYINVRIFILLFVIPTLPNLPIIPFNLLFCCSSLCSCFDFTDEGRGEELRAREIKVTGSYGAWENVTLTPNVGDRVRVARGFGKMVLGR
jgi:hypothetical protein